MRMNKYRWTHGKKGIALQTIAALGLTVSSTALKAADLPNACPVDGCVVTIAEAKIVKGEISLKLDANFQPDMAKNHLHIWWGDNFSFMQVSGNAETTHNVKQGAWHPTDIFPEYTTQGAVSVENRAGSNTLCVGAADRNHDVIDVNAYHCIDISSLF